MAGPRRNRPRAFAPLPPDCEPATEAELRRLFNDVCQILQKVATGEYEARVLTFKHPAEPLAGEEPCTLSQMIGYFNRFGKEIARAHQYLRPDQTIGLSGIPDPKRVFYKGILYFLPPFR